MPALYLCQMQAILGLALIIAWSSSSFTILHPKARNAGYRAAPASQRHRSSITDDFSARWRRDVEHGGKEAMVLTFDHSSTAEVLSEVFNQVLINEKDGKEAGQRLLLFPQAQKLRNEVLLRQLNGHLDLCKECCEILGISQNSEVLPAPVPAIVIKPIAQSQFAFDDDPYWNESDDDPPFAATWGNEEDDSELQEAERLYQVPKEDTDILRDTRGWTESVIADLGVCPFTFSAAKAGLPQGSIRYEIDRSSSVEEVYRKYWQEVALIAGGKHAKSERELSTTLLITPNFGLRNCEFFESFSNTLTHPLEALSLEDDIQLVFFHPEWVFRDGADRIGQENAANYARRSPWPMINILRTPQVRKAQKAIPTGLVYRQNEVTLDSIGASRLQTWLVNRDWHEVKDNFRVDRKSVPILSTAQDLLESGTTQARVEDLQPQAPLIEKPPSKQVIVEGAVEEEVERNAGPEAAKPPLPSHHSPVLGLEVDEDDWDAAFRGGGMLEQPEPQKSTRPRDEIVADSRAAVALLRKRLNGKAALTPAEVRQLEQLAERLQY